MRVNFFNGEMGNGGAIYKTEGSLTIAACGFQYNLANYGGAIYNSGGTIKIMGSAFAENAAFTQGSRQGWGSASEPYEYYEYNDNGGALYISGSSTVFIIDCAFQKNEAFRYDNGKGSVIFHIYADTVTGGSIATCSSNFSPNFCSGCKPHSAEGGYGVHCEDHNGEDGLGCAGGMSGSIIRCDDCPSGYFCPSGSMEPTACAPGKWSSSGRSADCADDCAGGSYCNAGGKSVCPEGSYCPLGSSHPTNCTDGSYCPKGSSNATSAYPFPAPAPALPPPEMPPPSPAPAPKQGLWPPPSEIDSRTSSPGPAPTPGLSRFPLWVLLVGLVLLPIAFYFGKRYSGQQTRTNNVVPHVAMNPMAPAEEPETDTLDTERDDSEEQESEVMEVIVNPTHYIATPSASTVQDVLVAEEKDASGYRTGVFRI